MQKIEPEAISRSENVASLKRAVEKSATTYDPIGGHLIELRVFYLNLSNLIQAEEMKNKNSRTPTEKLKVFLPKFPENYPFKSDLTNHRPKIRNEAGSMSKEEVDKIIEISVERLLSQVGFFDCNPEALKCLSFLTKTYLEMFGKIIQRNKSCGVFSGSKHLWGPLETTLREIEYDGIPGIRNSSVKNFFEMESMKDEKVEFGGIASLHAYFYNAVVKKHDEVLKECEKLLEKYKRLLS